MKVVASKTEIESFIQTISQLISKKFRKVLVCGILEGGKLYSERLVECLNLHEADVVLKFLNVSIYGNEKNPSLQTIDVYRVLNQIEDVLKDVDVTKIDGIVIVDDIVDTGATMIVVKEAFSMYLTTHLNETKQILTTSLINVVDAKPKFLIPNMYLLEGNRKDWYFGFGMDLDSRFRELDRICCIDRDTQDSSFVWSSKVVT